MKKKKIIIQGFGAVGAATAVNVVSSNNFRNNFCVHCIDRPNKEGYKKIFEAKQGIFPISTSDKSLGKYLKQGIKKNKITFGFDNKAYKNADIIIISINCDLKNNNLIKIDNFKKSIISILENISENTLILVESTVPPGTCEKIIYPKIKNILNKRGLDYNKIYLAHSFERVTPGRNYLTSCKNFFRVYSGINKVSEKKCREFLSKIINIKKYPLTKLNSITSSETCKLMENSYRAVNIAFIDEWLKFSNQLNINLFEIIDAIKKRVTHNNIMLPGLGVGGYCLTKDPLFAKISQKQIFKKNTSHFPLCSNAINVNKKMVNTSIDFIENNYKNKLKGKKIFIFGLSYKNEVGDIRHSPSINLINKLIKKKSKCYYFDPFVNTDVLSNSKRVNFISNLKMYDLIIFTVNHHKFKQIKVDKSEIKKGAYVFDLNNVLTDRQVSMIKKNKINFYSLGRNVL